MASLRLGELLSVPDEVFEANPQEPRIWWDATVVRVLGRCGQAQVELFFPHDGWKVTFKETEAVQWLVPFVPAPPKASSDLYLGQRVELYWAQDRKWFKATITQFMAGAAKNALLLYDDATVRAHALDGERWRLLNEPACRPLPEKLLPTPPGWTLRKGRPSSSGTDHGQTPQARYCSGRGHSAGSIPEAWRMYWGSVDEEPGTAPPSRRRLAQALTSPSDRPIKVPPALPRRRLPSPLLDPEAPQQGAHILIWFPTDATHVPARVTLVDHPCIEGDTNASELQYRLEYDDGGHGETFRESELLWQVSAKEAADREARAECGHEFRPQRISWLPHEALGQYSEAIDVARNEEQAHLRQWLGTYCEPDSRPNEQAHMPAGKLRSLRSLEIGSGSSRLSRKLHEQGWLTTLVESRAETIEWTSSFFKDSEKVILWKSDYNRLDNDKLPCFDLIHASVDCRTFSADGSGTHQRFECNSFCGTSEAAGAANESLERVINLIAEQLRRNPHAFFTFENPGSGGRMRFHPLIKQRLERLPGVQRFTVTYCFFGFGARKPTDFWTNCPSLIAFMTDAGSAGLQDRYYCSPCRPCAHFTNHASLHDDPKRGSAFPLDLCSNLALLFNSQLSARRLAAWAKEQGEAVPREAPLRSSSGAGPSGVCVLSPNVVVTVV